MKDHVRARWSGAVLVCGKCSKKLGGGFGDKGRTPLAKALRQEPGFGKGRKASVGVVETKCLGICPRKAVVVVDTQAPDRWRIVPEGADVALLGDVLRDAAD
ncbi:(2Fe-2S) ferredoxin domain-containing protein [Sphingomonas sp. HHU CXW]|uniref:(2Fe-2S) ferredoxin domain-containing protein n=1 Tax=Sphingomonas hominis TaxID=2741495 RepID=A0ABX2JEQ7_9SPHN|nr:(2Fe-2S) ferredoxin domain-containing protein [Sphingomonas hominis]